MEYSFAKYQGSGNDIIIFDDRDLLFPECTKEIVQKICHRQYGIGSDGMILLRKKEPDLFQMIFFNPDGSLVDMCGNGIRCLAKFIQSLGIEKEVYRIFSGGRIYACRITKEGVAVEMEQVQILASPFSLDKEFYCGHLVDSGVPHFIIPVEDIENIDVDKIGRKLRHHPAFFPGGVNVSFATLCRSEIKIRTYERGVEGETLCCGTAAVAAGFVANKMYEHKAPVTLLPMSGEKIVINISRKENSEKIEMVGNAVRTFIGKIEIS